MTNRNPLQSILNGANSREDSNSLGFSANELSSDVIDDAKRSVSFRINTSEYGCIKTIARKNRMRESDVFRYLLRVSLNALTPLYGSDAVNNEVLLGFSDKSTSVLDELNLDQLRLSHQLNINTGKSRAPLESCDVELLALAVQPLRYLAGRLSELTGGSVDTSNAVNALHEYLDAKYDWDSADDEGRSEPND